MKKLDGFKEIHNMGLPHPKWEFIKNHSDLKYVGSDDEYIGWTIRTCLDEGGDEFYLPHADWLKKEEIEKKIREFKEKIGEEATFVVYPSWEFNKSANIMFTEDKIVVEAVKGTISKLLYGGCPEFVAVFSRSSLPMKLHSEGDESLLTEDEIKMLIKLSNKIEGNKILQLSHTKKGKYFFHDLRELK